MDFLKLDNLGGLLAYQEVLAFMQSSYTFAVNNLCQLFGNNIIVSGCNVAGGQISNGIIIVNGEVMPFQGGVNTGFIEITETSETEEYENAGDQPFYFTRKGVPAASGVPLADFARIATLKDHVRNKSNPHEVTKNQIGLSEIPNAKSDSLVLDSNDSLATSRAAFLLNNKINSMGVIGVVKGIVSGDNSLVITHNLNIQGAYGAVLILNPNVSSIGGHDIVDITPNSLTIIVSGSVIGGEVAFLLIKIP